MSVYSKLLVLSQFIIILTLLFINDSIFSHTLSLFIFLSGCFFAIYTLYSNRLGNFNIQPEIKENAKLITTGAYRYVRHPMYLSVLLVMLAVSVTTITVENLILFEVLIYVLYLKARKEEELWKNRSDNEYEEYKKHTKMFIPFVI